MRLLGWKLRTLLQDVGAPDTFCFQHWASAALGQQEESFCTHARTRTHSQLPSLPLSPSTNSGFALPVFNGKGQRSTTGGTVFRRTVWGEFSAEFKT